MKPSPKGLCSPVSTPKSAVGWSESTIMKLALRFVATLSIVFIAFTACATYACVLSQQSADLESRRRMLESNPPLTHETEAQVEGLYLKAFPKTFVEFRKVFADELELTHPEHMLLLKRLADRYPRVVLDIWLSVSANAHYDADAVSMLQHQLAAYAAKETKTFATELMTKSDVERRNIVTFLADVENYSAYEDYATIISNLEKLGQTKLRHLFLDAKAKRMKYRHTPGE